MMRKLMVWFVILGLIVVSGCTRRTRDKGTTETKVTGEIMIEEINRSPDEYYGREIVIRGLITQSHDIPLLKHDIFKINDGTGEIWVYTEKGAMLDRIEVRIRGTLKKVVKLPFKLPENIEINRYIKLHRLEFLRI
jgi:hypothetical protein